MSDQYVQVAPNSTGLKIDTTELTVNGQTVERQRINIADSTNAEYFANVTSTGALQVDPSGVTLTTRLTDGTNGIVNVAAGDFGQNARITAGARHEVSFALTSAGNTTSLDVSNFACAVVQITSQGTGSTLTPQWSNDGTNWYSATLVISADTGFAFATTNTSSTGMFYVPVLSRYFRLSITGITAGTTAGIIELFTTARIPTAVSIETQAVGLASDGAAAAGSPLRVGGWDGTNIHTLRTDANGYTLTSSIPTSSGGLSTYKQISTASTNGAAVKTAAGQLYNIQATNNGGSAAYLKLYNLAAAPTVGTSVPVNTWMIPAGGGLVIELSNGLALSTGIAISVQGGIADTDATNVAANQIAVNLQYK